MSILDIVERASVVSNWLIRNFEYNNVWNHGGDKSCKHSWDMYYDQTRMNE